MSGHYLNQCWPKCLNKYGITGPQGVNEIPECWDQVDLNALNVFKTIQTCEWIGNFFTEAPIRIIAANNDKDKPWWRHQMEAFSALLALCVGIRRSPVNSPHKGQWRGILMFSFICAWINGWVNNREDGDLRRHITHYDVTVTMLTKMLAAYGITGSQWVNEIPTALDWMLRLT